MAAGFPAILQLPEFYFYRAEFVDNGTHANLGRYVAVCAVSVD